MVINGSMEIKGGQYCSGDIALLRVLEVFNDRLWSNLQLPGEDFSMMSPGIFLVQYKYFI